MKFNLGPTFSERSDVKKKWHTWFAWFPVRIKGTHYWLEPVLRRGESCIGCIFFMLKYEYKIIQPNMIDIRKYQPQEGQRINIHTALGHIVTGTWKSGLFVRDDAFHSEDSNLTHWWEV